MRVSERARELGKKRGLHQQKLTQHLCVNPSILSKVENERFNVGDYPSKKFVYRLAETLDADEDEFLLLTDRVPEVIRRRIQEQPDVFRRLVAMSDT